MSNVTVRLNGRKFQQLGIDLYIKGLFKGPFNQIQFDPFLANIATSSKSALNIFGVAFYCLIKQSRLEWLCKMSQSLSMRNWNTCVECMYCMITGWSTNVLRALIDILFNVYIGSVVNIVIMVNLLIVVMRLHLYLITFYNMMFILVDFLYSVRLLLQYWYMMFEFLGSACLIFINIYIIYKLYSVVSLLIVVIRLYK